MANELRFDGRVAIVTGAGGGLGRAHALLLARRGAKVVVNDLGGSIHGGGADTRPADKVALEIKEAGGEAITNYDSVEDGAKIVQAAMDTWGRIDIVINNAGILRDTSFQKLTEEDWDLIYRVHVLGGFRVTRAAWDHMRTAGYGRIIFTSSAAGIYGNFGQANYSMAKLGLLGLANTLAIEGKKRNILVNTIAPLAGSRLTETVLPKDLVDTLKPELVSPLVAYLCHEATTETGGLFEVGGGFFSKLRWQRTEGATFKLGRPIAPESVADAWGDITNFDKATFPPDITQSMQPVLQNLSSKSRGGNEHIDVDAALGYEFPPHTTSYTEKDLALYALGVGAASDPLDTKELQFVYELHPDGFRSLPTFGVIPAINSVIEMATQGKQAPGLKYGFERVLHGEQLTEVKRPLPSRATLTHKTRIKDIWDKGKNAVVVIETRSFDESGEELLYNEIGMVVRGAGGWGGDRGPSSDVNTPPDRAPDAVVEQKVNENQALLYRLSGDWNPLHADPGFAQNFGFPRPILHGLCTFGFVGRAAIKAFAKNDPRYFKSIRVRFADSVFPGETIVTELWKESDERVILRAKVKERDKVIVSNAAVELYKEIPAEKAKPKAAPAASSASSGATTSAAAPAAAPAEAAAFEPTSADILTGVAFYVETHPELASKLQTIFQINLTSPNSAWTIDLKNGKGSVKEGSGAGADVTLELSDADFLGMASGKLNPQKLYFAGKLKLTGNVMAAQKLEFLQKVDPEQVKEAMRKAGRLPASAGAGGAVSGASAGVPAAQAAPAAAPAAADPGKITGADIFIAIRDHVERNPDLAKSVQTIFQFKLKNPDAAFVIDLKNGNGSVSEGTAPAADVTLELSDEDFLAMSSGAADPQKLFMTGKLKITGNVMASQKLMFLKKMDPAAGKAAIGKAKGARSHGGGASAAEKPAKPAEPAAAPKVSSQAPALMKALADRLAKDAGIAGEVASLVQIKVTDPESAWVLDLRSGPGSVKEGTDASASTTLRLAEEDLIALAKGQSAADLFQRGKLRVDGDMRPAHKLGFLKGLA